MKRNLLIFRGLFSKYRFNALKFKVLLLFFLANLSSCYMEDMEDSLISNEPEKARLLKILYYSNSSASNLTGETVYEYDEAGIW